jgi:cephalosporin-C deacetylase-like acetyl esterase
MDLSSPLNIRQRHCLQAALVIFFLIMSKPVAMAATAPAEPFRELDRYEFDYAQAGSQLKDFIYERSRRYFAEGDTARDALQSPGAVRRRQEDIRRALLAGLGGLPPSDAPLNARVTGTVKGDGFTIEKIIFEARPHQYVTANLYLPANLQGRSAAVLFLCGHHQAAKQQPEYQVVCQTLVRAGLIVLAQDPVGQGERLSYYDPATQQTAVAACTRDHDTAGAQCRFLDEGIARYFLHDAMRSVDYLLSRPEVDPARIGVTGNSGGGTQTSLMMLTDPRVAAAAPGTFITTRDAYQRTGQSQDAEQIWSGFTRAGLDHEDILLAMAPKPVCVLAVTSDFFPIEGTRRTVTRARRIWKLFGADSALELQEDKSVHSFTPALAQAAAHFFAKHLLGREVDLTGFSPRPFPAEVLQCTKTGQVRGDFSDAEFVFDSTDAHARAAAKARAALSPEERRTQAAAWLREQVFRDRDSNPLNPRVIERARHVDGFDVDVAFWWSQPHLANLGMLIRPHGAKERRPVTIAVWDDGTAALSRHAGWIKAECDRGRAVFVLDLCGQGPLKPDPVNFRPPGHFYDTWHKFSDDLDWIGDSLVALRTYEVLRAIDVLSEWPELAGGEVRIHGYGRAGVHARLAAILDERIKGCDWAEGFTFSEFVRTRVYDSLDVKTLVLPGVLKHFDLDEL